MSERITESELCVVESLEEGNRSALLFARRLAADVRRLHRLILAMDARLAEARLHHLSRRVPEFFAEAKAIREEWPRIDPSVVHKGPDQ